MHFAPWVVVGLSRLKHNTVVCLVYRRTGPQLTIGQSIVRLDGFPLKTVLRSKLVGHVRRGQIVPISSLPGCSDVLSLPAKLSGSQVERRPSPEAGRASSSRHVQALFSRPKSTGLQ